MLARSKKKAIIAAHSIIAQAKKADPLAPPSVDDTPSVAPEPTKNVLTTTQWLSVISIIVSLVGVYYKREEIKNVFTKKATPPSPVLQRATQPPPVLPRTGKITSMD